MIALVFGHFLDHYTKRFPLGFSKLYQSFYDSDFYRWFLKRLEWLIGNVGSLTNTRCELMPASDAKKKKTSI